MKRQKREAVEDGMRRRAWVFALSCVLALAALAEVKSLLLVVRDLENRPLAGFRFGYQGAKSLPTDATGTTSLDLPAGHAPGRSVKLVLVGSPKPEDEWFLINPQINVPEPTTAGELVLAKRGQVRDRAATIRDEGLTLFTEKPDLSDSFLYDIAVFVLREFVPDQPVAASREKHPSLLSRATLRAFADTPAVRDRGIAAFLAQDYSGARSLFGGIDSRDAPQELDTLLFRGAAQLELEEFAAAEATFRKARRLAPNDTVVIRSLARALYEQQKWVESEQLVRLELSVLQSAYGRESAAVALSFNNLALLLQATRRAREAETTIRAADTILRSLQEETLSIPSNRDTVLWNYLYILQAQNRPRESIHTALLTLRLSDLAAKEWLRERQR